MRTASAKITLLSGRGVRTVFDVAQVETWQVEQSVDNDADQFSVDIGDSMNQLAASLDRDTEVRVNLFLTDQYGNRHQVFAGIADNDQLASTHTHSLQGRDVPSALLDTDALPGRWRHVKPKQFLAARGKKLGLTNLAIASMREIGTLWTDGTEKEWAFWYRVARTRGMYMWSTNTGGLVIDVLDYSLSAYSYSFGQPLPGEPASRWLKVIDVTQASQKSTRLSEVIVYGANPKQKIVRIGHSADPLIRSWSRKQVAVSTSTTAKTQKDLDDEAALEQFEAIVGVQEYVVTLADAGTDVRQNSTARVNLPDYGLVGTFYVVGVSRRASPDEGYVQEVRLRERGFALTTRVPAAPSITNPKDVADNKPTGNIATSLSDQGIRWADSFVRAAREFGSQNGWDLGVFLGVLLSICDVESGFLNERQKSGGSYDGVEWTPMPKGAPDQGLSPTDPFTGDPIFQAPTEAARQQMWREAFANAGRNSLNPFRPNEAGVGPMQLTTPTYKEWADDYGFGNGYSGVAKRGEYDGGRWNPPSNIRAAAKALYAKIVAVHADPTSPDSIWAAVRAYNGSGSAAENYMRRVKNKYTTTYASKANSALEATQNIVRGSAQRSFLNGQIVLRPGTPNEVAKAVTNAMSLLGQPYRFGGTDPASGLDCSSFVTWAIGSASPLLRSQLDMPRAGHHGETTFTLWRPGRFQAVGKDDLLPGDLVFFDGLDHSAFVPEGHVGMYLADGFFVHDPHTGDVVKVSSLGEDYYRQHYNGARRLFLWLRGSH